MDQDNQLPEMQQDDPQAQGDESANQFSALFGFMSLPCQNEGKLMWLSCVALLTQVSPDVALLVRHWPIAWCTDTSASRCVMRGYLMDRRVQDDKAHFGLDA
jgi:hypothetical protein